VCLALLVAAVSARADVVTFLPTGGEQTFTVPDGVTSVHVIAVGGMGGSGGGCPVECGGAGGFGAFASGDLLVTPGEVLYVEVGGNGALGDGGSQGGFNGGGAGGAGPTCNGGGGGGASDVRLAPRSVGTSLGLRIITAAGGGGGGGCHYFNPGATPGTGGNAGMAGGNGSGGGGQPGTSSGPGSGGGSTTCQGHSGDLGIGGAGGTTACNLGGGGGGGGAGVYGGGGGGGDGVGTAGGGGGGGGSGFATDATNTSISGDDTGSPAITFVYTPASPQTQHMLTVAKSGSGVGTVTSTDGQINCGSTCSRSYTAGVTVTLTASAASGSSFAGWSGAGCSGSGTCTVAMNSDQSVTATFELIPPGKPTVTVTIDRKHHRATFKFTATDATGFRCALAKQANKANNPRPPFVACRSPKTYKQLAPGNYLFEVRAISPAGIGAVVKRHFSI
jgi:hypothetical protein